MIDETLTLLHPLCDAEGAECVVIDSSEGRLAEIERRHPWVRWIAFQGPFGRKVTIPHQRNAGVRAANAPLVAFCDAGGVPDPMWLHEMRAALERRPDAAFCGPLSSVDSVLTHTSNDLDRDAPVFIGITANMGFRRSAFDAAGGFDERFDYGSDTDFGWQLNDAGTPLLCADTAWMGMKWGDTSRSFSRQRSYGRATVKLLRKHPRRAPKYFRLYPDLVAYPLWVMGMALALPLALAFWWIPVIWMGFLAVPILKNIRHGQLGAFMATKLYRAVVTIGAILRAPIPAHEPVLFIPRNEENPYLGHLERGLKHAGVEVALLPKRSFRGASLLALSLPLSLLWRRVRGLKVVHLHWTYGFSYPWAPRSVPLLRRIPRVLFALTILSSRAVGVRWVYSAHNVLPHRPVFDDDVAARKFLLTHLDGLITLTPAGAALLATTFDIPLPRTTFIPEGPPTVPPGPGRAVARGRWGISGDRHALVMFGHLDEYKRADFVLDSLLELTSPPPLSVVLAGSVSSSRYKEGLEQRASALREVGIDVILDIRQLSDDDIGSLLEAADGAIFAFSSMMNSTSLRMAASAGAAVIASDLPAFATIPGLIRFDPASATGLCAAVREAATATAESAATRRAALATWLASPSWDEVGWQTRGVYHEAMGR